MRSIRAELSAPRAFKGNWWRIRDLNPGPKDYDSSALTTELIRHAETHHFLSSSGNVSRLIVSRLIKACETSALLVSTAEAHDNMRFDLILND